MKISELLSLDCRKQDALDKLKSELCEKLPFLRTKSPSDLNVELLESVLNKMESKYPVRLAYVLKGPAEDGYYSFMIKRADNHEHIKTIYGVSMLEGFSKVVIYLYGYIKNNFKKEE